MATLLKIRLALRGRPIRSYTFNQQAVTIGRDPDCEIAIENTGISRRHARIEKTERGFFVEDLGSSNGTFLNDQPVRRDLLQHDDLVQIGKFTFWIGVESDRRDQPLLPKMVNPDAFEGTTVLSAEQMLKMQKRREEEEAEEEARVRSRIQKFQEQLSTLNFLTALGAAFTVGLFVGVAVTFLFNK